MRAVVTAVDRSRGMLEVAQQRAVEAGADIDFARADTVALPFAVNLTANLIFTPIQFGLRNLTLASIDILIVWGSIIWMAVAVWKHYRWVAVAQAPYFAWVSTATVLQLSISWMNR